MENKLLQAQESLSIEMPTLRSLAEAVNTPPTRLYSVAKQPIVGQPYDPETKNWDAIERYIERRLDGKTFESLLLEALELDAEYANNDKRKAPAGTVTARARLTLDDGTTVAARRYDFKVNDWVLMKKDETNRVYIIVYSTDTHLVLRDLQGPELLCVSNNTSNWKLVAPFNFNAEVNKRGIDLSKIQEVAAEKGTIV